MNNTMIKTKERYLIESLKLFAEKGYDGVSVAEIANAMGVSTPALYKHFPNKKALFDELMMMSQQGYSKQMEHLQGDFRVPPGKRKEFVAMSEEHQIKVVQELFLHTYEDEFPSLFRRFMTIEQFHHPELAVLLNRRYIDSQFDAFEPLMQEFIDAGIYTNGNARAMAIQYASPLILCFDICDREPERKDWALKMLAEHVRQFNKTYRRRNGVEALKTKLFGNRSSK